MSSSSKYPAIAWLLTRPWMTGLLVFALFFTACFFIIKQRYDLQQSEEEKLTTNIAEDVKNRLQQSLQYSLSATNALTLVIDKDGVPRNFDSIASYILVNNKFIDALELVPRGIIRYIYPLEGNEAAIGYDILKDSTTNVEAHTAIEKREIFFAGPLHLRQGGIGVVGRLPFYQHNKFWGFSAAIIKLETLLRAAGIDTTGRDGYYYQLSKINPLSKKEEFFLPDMINHTTGKAITIPISSGDWNLTVIPVNGLKPIQSIIPIGILSLILCILGAAFAVYLSRTKSRALKESQLRLKTILDTDPECIKLISRDIKPIEINPAGLKMIEADNFDQIKNRSFLTVVSEQYRERLIELLREVFKGESVRYEFEMQALKGSKRWCQISMVPFRDTNNNIIAALGVTRDMTDWKKAEQELKRSFEEIRRLTDHLQTIREEERMHVAREIHDELGQQLTVLKIDISNLGKKITNKELHPEIQEMIDAVNTMVGIVRKITSDLRPGLLDDLGLIPAIEWYSQDFSVRSGINIHFDSHLVADDSLPEKVNIGLFRIFQESLINIVGLSEADKAAVLLTQNDHHLILQIDDNSKGDQDKKLTEIGNPDIVSIKERALAIGGKFSIQRDPGQGNHIEVVIPF